MAQKAENSVYVFRPWLLLCENERHACCLLPILSSMKSPSALQILAWAIIEPTQADGSVRATKVLPANLDGPRWIIDLHKRMSACEIFYSIVHTCWQLILKKKSSLLFYKSTGSSGVIGSFFQNSNCGMLGVDFPVGM